MSKIFAPLTVIPGVRRRVDPETHMAMTLEGLPLWDMPPPVRYAEHHRWVKRGKKWVAETIRVPIYRGTSAAYARWAKSQIRRNRRLVAEAAAPMEKAKHKALQEAAV